MEGRCIYRIKNLKSKGGKNTKYWVGWGYTVNLVWVRRKKNTDRALRWLGIWDWLTECADFWSRGAFTETQKLSMFPFADMAPWARAAPLWA